MVRTKDDGTEQIGIWFTKNEIDIIMDSLTLINGSSVGNSARKLHHEIQYIKIKADLKFKQEKSIPVVKENCEVCD